MTRYPVLVREIVSAIDNETRIAIALRDALLRQRAMVARADGAAVNEAGDAVGNVLHMLDEARRHRDALMARIDGPVTLATLATAADPDDRGALDAARARLRRAAEDVTHVAAVNREVLRRSMEAGEAFLQELFSSVAGPAPCYRAGEGPDTARPAAGVLLNRSA